MKTFTLFITLITILSFFLALTGCSEPVYDTEPLKSNPELGVQTAQKPNWHIGDYWVVKQTKTINDKTDINFYIYTVKNETFLHATIPYTAKENDLNLKALYMRQSKTFEELQNSTPEGDNLISENVYVLHRYEPIKLEPRYTGCPKPTYYQLDFESEKLSKEFAYATYDLRLVWDPDIPGRQLKYFHWPLQTGKYWSYPIINLGSKEGQKFVDEKILAAKKEGFDIKPHEVFSRAMISDQNNQSFIIDISHLYPFFANYDRNEVVIIYDNQSKFWTEEYHSDLVGVATNQTQEIIMYGTNFSEDLFQNLTPMINYTVLAPNSTC